MQASFKDEMDFGLQVLPSFNRLEIEGRPSNSLERGSPEKLLRFQ